ncbi:MAG: hypothetical protein H6739_27675 [Alphaproteobacteria bacterium]|nr:hypothetical protein [Alphaproteobacteria bacterium]
MPKSDASPPDTPGIWFTVDRQRFFAIPTEADLPDGQLALRRLNGPGRAVDPDAVQPFEISRQEATDALGQRIEAVYSDARDALRRLAGRANSDLDGVLPESLGDLLGLAPGALVTDPDAVRARFRPRIDPEEEDPTPALDETLRDLGGRLRALVRSPEMASALDALGDRLHKVAEELRHPPDAEPDNVVEFPGARRAPADDELEEE